MNFRRRRDQKEMHEVSTFFKFTWLKPRRGRLQFNMMRTTFILKHELKADYTIHAPLTEISDFLCFKKNKPGLSYQSCFFHCSCWFRRKTKLNVSTYIYVECIKRYVTLLYQLLLSRF